MTTYRTHGAGLLAALFVVVAGLLFSPVFASAQGAGAGGGGASSSTSTEPETMTFDLEKKFSGPVPEGYTADQFTFTIVGGEIDETVSLTHQTDDYAMGTIELPVGTYDITENGPDGWIREDWTIQWSGAGCQNEGDAIGTVITVDESDLDKTNFGCRADNQYKPDIPDDSSTTTDPENGGIEGAKYDDALDAPIEGWMMYLYDGQSLVMSTTTDASGMYAFTNVAPGDYLVCEAMPEMWKQVSPSDGPVCENGTYGHTVTVSGGLVTDAHDFTNIHDPVIIIDKVTSPDSSDTEFEFALSWSSSTVMLSDTDEPWNSGDLSDVMDVENPFSVTEINIPEGWELASVSCVSNLGHTETADAIDLNPGEIVTCTFTNRTDDDNGGGGQCVDESPGWADSVEGSNQAKRNNGDDITNPDRLDPSNALGAADWTAGGDTGFFSLGFGGWITVLFDKFVPDVDGDDISIHEATNGDDYPEEMATVEVSQDGSTWFSVGTSSNMDDPSTRVSYFDFASTGLAWIKYVRVTDTTNGELHDEEADGFDLDAVDATQELCEEPGGGDDGDNGDGDDGGDTPSYSQGSYGGGGDRVELREGGGGSSSGGDSDPEPEVLGEQVSAVPTGAPNTGAGGAAPTALPIAVTLLLTVAALGTLRVTRTHG